VGFRILMIDDEVDLVESLKETLEIDFAEVVTCHKPEQAYGISMSSPFDLIISDHNMAEVNGLELLKILRSEGIMTPFILMTGYASKEITIDSLRLGISDLLEKPVDLNELKMAISRVMELEKNRSFYYKTFGQETPEVIQARRQFSQRLGHFLGSIQIKKSA
jgi:DNA-binding NtrC family response regulator